MEFETFKANVEQWAEERGIYAHSTTRAQALKAVSEVGELADALIKNDRAALADAVGDVAVCVVNVARLGGADLTAARTASPFFTVDAVVDVVSDTADMLAVTGDSRHLARCCEAVLESLAGVAGANGLNFDECLAGAWNEIKDRKGRMVPGGAFVKESA